MLICPNSEQHFAGAGTTMGNTRRRGYCNRQRIKQRYSLELTPNDMLIGWDGKVHEYRIMLTEELLAQLN